MNDYMAALEAARTRKDIAPFADFLDGPVQDAFGEVPGKDTAWKVNKPSLGYRALATRPPQTLPCRLTRNSQSWFLDLSVKYSRR